MAQALSASAAKAYVERVKALLDAAKNVIKYRGMEEYVELNLAIRALEVPADGL